VLTEDIWVVAVVQPFVILDSSPCLPSGSGVFSLEEALVRQPQMRFLMDLPGARRSCKRLGGSAG
jgi:hypothetical protein